MSNNKKLLVYYSFTGNIESLIPMLKKELNADILKLEPVVPYPDGDKEFLKRYHDEIDNKLLPECKEISVDFTTYSTIYLMIQNWSNTFPPTTRTFLSKGLFKDKTVIPFITHDRNGEVDIVDQIKPYIKGNKITKALVFDGRNLSSEQVKMFIKSVT